MTEGQRLLERYGPWAVVTGASDGIGREFALRLSAAGLGVVLVARRRERLDALAAELSGPARVLALDVAAPGALDELATATRELDVGLLVAAAGFGTSGNFIDRPLDEELALIDVNCRAVAGAAHVFARRFAAQRRGGLVLMSSLLAFQGVPRAANYAASKAWVQSFAEGIGRELAPLGVDVVASAPGPIHSGFAARAHMRMSLAQTPAAVAATTLAALGRRATVRPGWLAKLLEAALALLPRRGRVLAMSRVMKSMTRHQLEAQRGG